REMDAAAALRARRDGLEAALQEIVAALGSDAASGSDPRVGELLDLAPPGIDELLGVLSVIGAVSAHPLIVVDTAPTGHALRLLERPHVARDWVHVLMRVLLKSRVLVRPGRLAADLVELSQSIHRLQDLLNDAAACRFIVVTRAARLPRLETERLVDRLRRLRLSVPAVIVDALTLAPGTCRRCLAVASAERNELAALERRFRRRLRECAIILTPLAEPPPRGAAALERWGTRWRSLKSEV